MTDETVAYMGWSLSAQEQIDGFRREVRELKAENAKLRELGEQYETVLADYRSKVAKLRELAARAWLLFIEHGAVHPSELPEVDSVRDELRELGIEAEECTTR